MTNKTTLGCCMSSMIFWKSTHATGRTTRLVPGLQIAKTLPVHQIVSTGGSLSSLLTSPTNSPHKKSKYHKSSSQGQAFNTPRSRASRSWNNNWVYSTPYDSILLLVILTAAFKVWVSECITKTKTEHDVSQVSIFVFLLPWTLGFVFKVWLFKYETLFYCTKETLGCARILWACLKFWSKWQKF